jgi:RimJ/RimL family protein N-acetyltransferase
MSQGSRPHAAEHELLDDGLEVLIRPIRPADKRPLREAFERLSPQTRYRRFFAPLTRLTEQDLRYLTEVDHRDHEAIAAVNPENGAIVGVARYVRAEDPGEAEVAIVVGDPWQGHGVATALLRRLVVRAREAGIDHFVALVMSDNEDAIELFGHLAPGGSSTRRSASGHTEMVIELPDPDRIGESALGRALRAAAGGLRINPWRILRQRIDARE